VGSPFAPTQMSGCYPRGAQRIDPRYLLDSITHKHGQTTLAAIGYPSRDDAGSPLSMTDWTGSWSYGYDANNRLITATPPNPVPEQPAGGPYGYDWVGNRIHPPAEPNPMVYNAADQLLTWPGMHTYTYYPDGSMQYERNAAGTQTMKSYTYTPDGLLDEAEFDFTNPTTRRYLANTWDADKNRVQYVSGAKVGETRTPEHTHTLVYDTTAGIPAVIAEDASVPANGVYYIREPGGELLAMIDPVAGIRYYHFDQLGSTRLLTDTDGDVTDDYAYDAYGALLVHNRHADSVDQPYQYVGQLGYYTHYEEPGFGLMQLGVRFYDASAARFAERDQIKVAGSSEYWYGIGCPTRMTDPSGRQALTYPVFEAGSRCSDPDHGPNAARHIAIAQRYVKWLVQKLGLKTCPAKMKVHCYMKIKCTFSRRQNRECGRAGWHSGWDHMHVNFAPQCSNAYCIILHEMIHNCTGASEGHKLHGQVGIPGCGAGFGEVDPNEDYQPDPDL